MNEVLEDFTLGPPEASEKVVEHHRLELAAAAERRRIRKARAHGVKQSEFRAADDEMADLLIEAREAGVSWSDLSAATGLSRQMLNNIVAARQKR